MASHVPFLHGSSAWGFTLAELYYTPMNRTRGIGYERELRETRNVLRQVHEAFLETPLSTNFSARHVVTLASLFFRRFYASPRVSFETHPIPQHAAAATFIAFKTLHLRVGCADITRVFGDRPLLRIAPPQGAEAAAHAEALIVRAEFDMLRELNFDFSPEAGSPVLAVQARFAADRLAECLAEAEAQRVAERVRDAGARAWEFSPRLYTDTDLCLRFLEPTLSLALLCAELTQDGEHGIVSEILKMRPRAADEVAQCAAEVLHVLRCTRAGEEFLPPIPNE